MFGKAYICRGYVTRFRLLYSQKLHIYIYIYTYTYTYINKIDNFDAGGVSVSSKYNNNNINIDYI